MTPKGPLPRRRHARRRTILTPPALADLGLAFGWRRRRRRFGRKVIAGIAGQAGAGVEHDVLAHAEHVLIVRLGDRQALIEVDLGHVQAGLGVALHQQGGQAVIGIFASLAQGGDRRQLQGAGDQRGIGGVSAGGGLLKSAMIAASTPMAVNTGLKGGTQESGLAMA